MEGHLSTVHILLQHRANIDAVDNSGRTAVHKCVLKGHLQLLDYLRFKGLDITVPDKDGRTAAHWAAYMGQIFCLDYFLIHARSMVLEAPGQSSTLPQLSTRTRLMCESIFRLHRF